MDISGKVYILVGLFVTAYSFFVGTMNNDTGVQKFSVFIIVGIVFVAVGIFKLLFAAKKSNIQTKKVQPMQNIVQPQQPVKQQGHVHKMVKYCGNCGTVSNFNDRFCRMCGNHQFYRK